MARTTTPTGSFVPQRTQDRARAALLEHLATLPVGHRLPPIKELARRLQFGHSNLNEAMRQLARQGVVYSRPKLGTFLARHPGTPLAAVATDHKATLRGRRVLLRLADGGTPDAALLAIAQSAEHHLNELGAQVRIDRTVMLSLPDDVEHDLAVLVNPPRTLCESLPASRPVVIASTSWHARTMAKVPCDLVGLDQLSGASMAGEAMRAAGCRQVCFLGRADSNKQYDPISQVRLEGLELGWGEAIPREQQLNTKGFSVAGGGRGFARWSALSPRPMGVFAVCDEVAIGFLVAAMGAGLKPMRDFHLIGFDGLASGQNTDIGLTTVGAPVQAMGRTAAELAVQRLLEPTRPIQVTYLGCHLIQGKTAAAPRKRRALT